MTNATTQTIQGALSNLAVTVNQAGNLVLSGGNLLGNLLCGVAHLHDSNGSTTGLAAVLNNLLRGLGLSSSNGETSNVGGFGRPPSLQVMGARQAKLSQT